MFLSGRGIVGKTPVDEVLAVAGRHGSGNIRFRELLKFKINFATGLPATVARTAPYTLVNAPCASEEPWRQRITAPLRPFLRSIPAAPRRAPSSSPY